MSNKVNFVCPKCGNTSYETGEIRTTGGFLSKLLDVQNKKFTHVTCKRCKYTEFFHARVSLREHEVLFAPLKRTELLRTELLRSRNEIT